MPRAQLERLLREELEGRERDAVEAHVADCATCQRALDELTQDTLGSAEKPCAWEEPDTEAMTDPGVLRLFNEQSTLGSKGPRAGAGRDLLFGLLALQTGLIDQSDFVAAYHAWALEKRRSMAKLLQDQGAIDASCRALLQGLVAEHLKLHSGDTEMSLAALGAGGSTCDRLRRLGDTELSTALTYLWPDATLGGDLTHLHPASPGVNSPNEEGQRFRLLRPHAMGGLGIVFVAYDEQLHREVALKQIQDRRADDPTSRSRFLLEAEITGRLEHPGVVPVYGLGSYPNGRPYYAMRLIRGDSLKKAVAEFHADRKLKHDAGARELALRKLLRRFLDVCNVIDYAHGQGVLHRDLKPGNVMVGPYGETLVVDWGLAKERGRTDPGSTPGERLLTSASGSGSEETLPGTALGTPAYMSPEQAAGGTAQLGPLSDVYSLGATLYSLLTGYTPFGEGNAATVMEAVQKGAFTPPRQVNRSIDPALEAVCLKAMALRPEDRYSSPRALADDIECWMADEPVSARREPLAERSRRWMRRRRTAVVTGAAAVLFALIALAVVLAVQSRANRELKLANRRESKANADLRLANKREQERFELALEAIRSFHTGVSEDVLLKQKEFEELRTKLLRGALEFYAKLEGLLSAQSDRRSRAALGRAYYELGELTERIGSKQESLQMHRRALAVRRALAHDPGADEESRAELGHSLLATGMLLAETGDLTSAEALNEEARLLLEDLVRTAPGIPSFAAYLADCYHRSGVLETIIGRPAKALAAYERAIAIREPLAKANPTLSAVQRDLAWTSSNIGNLLSATGRPAEALAAHEKALAIREPLARANPSLPELQSDLASTLANIGNLRARAGRLPEALASYQQALEIREALVKANPTITAFQRELASCHNDIGDLLSATGQLTKAMASYEQALAIRESLARANATVPRFQSDLALSHASIGGLYAAMGQQTEALASHEQALAIREALASAHPSVSAYQRDLAISHNAMGSLLHRTGHPAEALVAYEQTIAIRETLVKTTPSVTRIQDDLAGSHVNIGDVFLTTGRPVEALAAYERAISIRAPLALANPSLPAYQNHLIDDYEHYAMARQTFGQPSEAVEPYHQIIAILEKLPQDSPNVLYAQASFHARLSVVALNEDSGLTAAEGLAEADRAANCLRRAVAAGFRDLMRLQSDRALDALRARPDVQTLVIDLKFPDWPFADEISPPLPK
ncbi:MAG TPA: tetratricopeptide repeat protein [Isosphaeraceae bacterium]|nr:tetratricopeptide repeat protein [Isosphaeraceae bacterium]